MRKNRLHILVRTSLAISAISGRRAILRRVTVVWSCVSRPISRAWRSANMARSNVPGMPRKSSCDGGVRPVQADGHARNAGCLESFDGFGRQQRRGAGGDVGAQADLHRVADQVEQVGPLQRIAAREHHQRLAERADFVQQAVSLFGGQLVRVPLGLGRGPAMHARQVAGLGHFPDHQHRGLIEVHRFSSLFARRNSVAFELPRKIDGKYSIWYS